MAIRTLDVALSQLGVAEETGNNDGIPADRYMRGDKLPWCAGFLLWCNIASNDRKIAMNTKDYYYLRVVENLEKYFQENSWWTAATETTVPEPNDLVFFAFRGRSDAGPGRHVAIVESFDMDSRALHTVEGNWGNKVARETRHFPFEGITGYGRWAA